MQQYHPLEVRLGLHADPARIQRTLVGSRAAQLDQAAYPNEDDEDRVPVQAHCSRSSSALTPGPKPIAIAYSPTAGSPRSHWSSTKMMVALDRLPTSRSTSQEGCVAARDRPSAS